jgi:hypothetical protein
MGTFDQSGLNESEFGIYAVGTFRIQGEEDESKQPFFNISTVDCEKQTDDNDRKFLQCKVIVAAVWATSDPPDSKNPNCTLDLDTSVYAMQDMGRGILAGVAESGLCYNATLTIDRNARRVFRSFTLSKSAAALDQKRAGTCGSPPPTQVMMNCTSWAKSRKSGITSSRYCDFSNSSNK